CNKDGALVTDSKDRPTTSKSGMPSWLKRGIMFAILGAVLVIVYFILGAFLPRCGGGGRGGPSTGGLPGVIGGGRVCLGFVGGGGVALPCRRRRRQLAKARAQ